MNQAKKYKVLIVDDSLSMCKFVEKVLQADPELEVVDYALDAYEARAKIKLHNPDVLTLDVEMPGMDGLTFLRNLMRLRPMPVVMLSSLTAAGAQVTLDALAEGAVDFMVKRHPGDGDELNLYTREIVDRVKAAAGTNINRSRIAKTQAALPDILEYKKKLRNGNAPNTSIRRIIAIGSSTGGPEALHQLLSNLERGPFSLVFAQHMPDRFMKSFAERLNSWSSFDIKIAESGEEIKPGCGYLPNGDDHLKVVQKGDRLYCIQQHSGAVNGHRPSVDVLFNSLVDSVGNGAVGVLLTGMGDDGAAGLTRMKESGSLTLIQDKKSSAVWGMPGRAHEMGGVDGVLDLQQIGPTITELMRATG